MNVKDPGLYVRKAEGSGSGEIFKEEATRQRD